eukprot:1377004-Rhodomonas_salina.1
MVTTDGNTNAGDCGLFAALESLVWLEGLGSTLSLRLRLSRRKRKRRRRRRRRRCKRESKSRRKQSDATRA